MTNAARCGPTSNSRFAGAASIQLSNGPNCRIGKPKCQLTSRWSMRPSSPALTAERSVSYAGLNRKLWLTATATPFSAARAASAVHARLSSPIGFSNRTDFPASTIVHAASECSAGGSRICTTSQSEAASCSMESSTLGMAYFAAAAAARGREESQPHSS